MSEKIEITQEQAADYNRAIKLLNSLAGHKEKGLEVKKMMKEVDPDLSFPELDLIEKVKAPYDEKIKSLEETTSKVVKEWDEYKTSEKNSKEERSIKKELEAAQQEYSFTDDGMQKVVSRMKEKNNPDVEAAAAWVASKQPKAQPSASSNFTPGKMNLFGSATKDDAWADLNKDPMGAFDKEVDNIFNNPENYKEFGGAL